MPIELEQFENQPRAEYPDLVKGQVVEVVEEVIGIERLEGFEIGKVVEFREYVDLGFARAIILKSPSTLDYCVTRERDVRPVLPPIDVIDDKDELKEGIYEHYSEYDFS